MHRVSGKGLSSFIFGLLCATAVIMGVLYFLNNSSSGLRQEASANQKPPVEVLRPKGAGTPLPDANTASQSFTLEPSASRPIANDKAASSPEPSRANRNDNKADRAASDVAMAQASKPKIAPPKPSEPPRKSAPAAAPTPTPEQILDKGNIEKAHEEVVRNQRNQAQRDNKPAANATRPSRHADVKEPTPQQILDSGNIEKANAAVRREQEQRNNSTRSSSRNNEAATPRQRDNAASSRANAENQRNNAASGSRRVQAGAYDSERKAREIQQRLRGMGINAQIQPITRNGKTLYRVRSNQRLSDDAAKELSNRIRSSGIDADVVR